MSLFVPLSFYLKRETGINTLKKKNKDKQTMGLISEETVVVLHLGSDKANLEESIQGQITTIRIS